MSNQHFHQPVSPVKLRPEPPLTRNGRVSAQCLTTELSGDGHTSIALQGTADLEDSENQHDVLFQSDRYRPYFRVIETAPYSVPPF